MRFVVVDCATCIFITSGHNDPNSNQINGGRIKRFCENLKSLQLQARITFFRAIPTEMVVRLRLLPGIEPQGSGHRLSRKLALTDSEHFFDLGWIENHQSSKNGNSTIPQDSVQKRSYQNDWLGCQASWQTCSIPNEQISHPVSQRATHPRAMK